MKIFKAEKDAGLVEQIRASSSLAYVSQLQPVDPTTAFAQRLIKAVASEKHPSDTLYPMKDVLVTTGWNLNTDVFDNGETWIARNTPVHHPLNLEHNEKDIIGNITASQAVAEDMSPINDDAAIDELPSKFHILNGSVIYRVWQDEERQKVIDTVIREIENGEWYISMECIFKGFDYAVIRPDGTSAVIARNEDSAFLTKHLRHYGGTGVYKCNASGEEFKLGRVLRNINFIGKGLVRQPANPQSVIINNVTTFSSTAADLGYIKAVSYYNDINTQPEEDNNMSTVDDTNNNINVKRLEDRVAELLKQNEAFAVQLKEKDGQATKAEIDTLRNEVNVRDNKISTLEASVSELRETVNSLTKRADEAEGKVAILQAEKVEQSRLDILKGKGAPPEKAAELVKKFTKFTDEEFNDLVDTLSAAWKPANAEDVLNKAKADKSKDPSLTVDDNVNQDDKTNQRIAKAAKVISGFLRYNNNVLAETD